jgi:hypothetical protein
MKCQICEQPINPNEKGIYIKVEGWTKKRTEGGYNQISEVQHLGKLAHSYCFEEGNNQKLL